MGGGNNSFLTPPKVVKQKPKKYLPPPSHPPPVTTLNTTSSTSTEADEAYTDPGKVNSLENGTGTHKNKKYKTLEINTLDVPHIYTATSPIQDDSSVESNELNDSFNDEYVIPYDIESPQNSGMYQGLQINTQDYLALYVTPGLSNHCIERPIYDEPSPNS